MKVTLNVVVLFLETMTAGFGL